MTINAVRLSHAVLFVADLERSIAFYHWAFGMTVIACEPCANAAFLRRREHPGTRRVTSRGTRSAKRVGCPIRAAVGR